MKIRCLLTASCVFIVLAGGARADEDSEFIEQDFLFQFEEAYTQEKGETQIGGKFDHGFGPSSSVFEFEIEYGITDRIEVSVEAPIVVGPGPAGTGDIEFGVDYALTMDNGSVPALTIGFGASAPTGNEDAGRGVDAWSYETSLRASKRITDNFYGHAMGAYEWTPNGGADADMLSAWAFGVGAALRTTDKLTLIAEYLREAEREKEAGMVERETEAFLSAGAIVELNKFVSIGVAGAAGVSDESADARALAKMQIEW